MNALFKCKKCEKEFYHSLNNDGLFVRKCPYCGHDYMDCLNLDESIEYCKKLDKIRGYIKNE